MTNLTDSFDRTIVEQRWAPSGDLLFTAALGIYTHLFAVRTNGAIEPLASGAFTISSFSARPVGTAVYAARESAIEATELWRLDSSGATRLTRLNRRAEGWRLGRQEVVRWQAPDGLAIEGLLTYPVGYREGRRYPLIVNAAGRGAGRVRAALDPRDPHRLFATQGYAVLAPQMRGGQGYGEGFATARPMDLAGGELTDLLAGVDHLIERGIADPERLALLGRGSSDEGVDLVSRVIARTPRFQAAVLSYGDLAPVGTLRPTDTRAARLDRLERDDLPPIELMRSVRTPLLIIDAEPGTRVSRPKQVHSALSDLERPVQYVEVNPEDRAGLRPRDAVDLFFRQLRWLDRYLKFGGADLFDFYLTGEWVPGPEGWQLQLARAEPRADYSGMKPEGGRYLEVELAFRPDDDLVREDSGSGLSLDPAQAIQLTDPEARARPLAGTVTELFGNETLIMGAPGVLSIPPSGDTLPTTVSLKLAFEISDQAAEYRLFVRGYRPVRVYVSGRR